MKVNIITNTSKYEEQRESSNRNDKYVQASKQIKDSKNNNNISFYEILKKKIN
ncbi:hypothetical protein [Clostridium folliculivorans]|uniref:Uncharacterized protein n=1 Tax=Clostridium folliculivorans TaxID=2886038 RepID=A0A9W6DC36_9CLOT|nr:hypothetical protein [Clostridium folliculivorans]GKU26582.1 hypothetical protein CFOLD11_34090 [Clostridium folliculivorans]GKU28986.1 hypothetical protein CFB3_10920 [Clostridium folliculivorans]